MPMKILSRDKGISNELYFFKGHEPLVTKLLSNELRKGMNCLDVGSNIGYYVLLEAKIVGRNGSIISIEPSSQNFLTTDRSNWSRIDEKYFKFFPPTKIVRSEKIQVKKLDSFMEQINLDKLDIIRMDVDGYEYKILDGMIQTLKKFKPTIIMETHLANMGLSNTKKFLQKLNDLSYEVIYYVPRNLDFSWIASTKQIKKFTIKDLCKKMEHDLLPSTFTLVLKSQSKFSEIGR